MVGLGVSVLAIRTVMIVVPDYRNQRIEVNAGAVDGRHNAEVRILPLFSREKPHVETVTCLKLTAEYAERSGEIWARRWSISRRNRDDPARVRVEVDRGPGRDRSLRGNQAYGCPALRLAADSSRKCT